ncbi:ABC transporter [Salipaludibacillus keqinensis]|uniref:ABC transporter n=1 Tax=Salipaludibacillus keqinensis TaxID=2045207 RepID=A0A323TIN5_9BACI|nr:ATP-binding cassette domain-containing protein [Salipaludibacillus keqinensis]PYZ94066.1 ABC transporter [Salipaludibacillus keqinensis]
MTNWMEFHHFTCKKSVTTIVTLDHLSISKGQIIGIMGENGTGKSTLLKAMSLLEPPAAGTMIYKGKSINITTPPLSIRREWACVFQHSYRFVGTVFENVEIGLKIRKVRKKDRYKRVMMWLDKFKIPHLANVQAHKLSGGEAQRMNLARAFVLEPSVLFLDEPFSALDFPIKMVLLEELQQVLTETCTTTFLISHDLTDIEFLASHLLYLYNGKVTDKGRIHDVLLSPSPQLKSFLHPWHKARSSQSLIPSSQSLSSEF